MRKFLTSTVLVAAVLAIAPATAAHADRLEAPDTTVAHVRVTYVEPTGREALYVELNNGSTWSLAPCNYEDGSGQRGGCYWDASDRGNNVGRSFVVLPGQRFVYSKMIGAAR